MDGNIKNQRILTSCFSCERGLAREDISVVSKAHAKTVFHITCHHCQTSTLVTLQSGAEGIMGLAVVTDLGKNEMEEKLSNSVISADKVLDVYEILNSL